MTDDLPGRLDDLGRRPVPPPDPAFTAELETRLLAVAASRPPAPPEPPRRILIAPRIAVGALGLAALAVMIALAAGMLRPDPEPGAAPELAGPVNIEVSLADGTILEDPDGLLLPEGAVVTVGPGGSGRIGDTVLEPGDVVTIHGGRAEVARPSPVGVVPPATANPTPKGSSAPRPTATAATGGSRPTATSAAPSLAPTPSPGQTPSPSPGATARSSPRPTPTTAPSLAPTASPTPATVRPRLRARLVSGPRIAVRWTATWGASSYLLLATLSRSGPAADPVLPGARVLGEFAAPPEKALRFRVPDRVVEVKLRVLALRADGTVLRRSRIVTIPVPSDTTGDGAGDTTPGPTTQPTAIPTSSPSPAP